MIVLAVLFSSAARTHYATFGGHFPQAMHDVDEVRAEERNTEPQLGRRQYIVFREIVIEVCPDARGSICQSASVIFAHITNERMD